jgi:membrane dipeptidase
VRALAEKHPETWGLATSAGDVRRIVGDGKIAALLGLEGGYASKTSNATTNSECVICPLRGA